MSIIEISVYSGESRYVFFLMIRRPPRSTLDRSSAASDVYKRQVEEGAGAFVKAAAAGFLEEAGVAEGGGAWTLRCLSLIHISEPTRPY